MILSRDLQKQINELPIPETIQKESKLVINSDGSFYIRSKFNEEKDIIISHYINGNNILSFYCTWLGPNNLTDEQLKSDTYVISLHADSTNPLQNMDVYWHLFAQHGYCVPFVENSVSLTDADVNSIWKD